MGRIVQRWTDEEIATVISMHAAGKHIYLIANKVGRSRRSVQKIINAQKGEFQMPKRMPKLATGEARLAERLREKAVAASSPKTQDFSLPPVAAQPDLIEPDVTEQVVDDELAPRQTEGG